MFTSSIWQPRSASSGRPTGHAKHAKARVGHDLAQKRRSRPRLEILEERTVPSAFSTLILNGGGTGYTGLGGVDPPDTCGAAGPSEYIEVINGNIKLFSNKATGTPSQTTKLDTFLYTTGGLTKQPGRNGRDSTMLFDNLIGRFIIGDDDANSVANTSSFDFGVSKTDNPTTFTAADWNWYQINTTEGSNFTDYPGNPGFNADAVVITFNMANGTSLTGDSQIVSINATDLANGVSQATLTASGVFHNDISGNESYRPTSMHDSAPGDPMWLIRNPGTGNSIDVVKMTNVLSSSASFSSPTSLSLPGADNFSSLSISPKNPDGSSMNNFIDDRILKAGEYKNTIVATHHVQVSGNELDVQWYAIDVSGTPSLQVVKRIGYGSNTYTFMPAIDINSIGQIGLTFMESDTNGGSANATTGGNASMFLATYAAGTAQTPVLVPAGTGTGKITDRVGTSAA
jgi:hypothetical protein